MMAFLRGCIRQAQQLGAFGHLVAHGKQQRQHLAIARGGDGVLHLHGLHHRQRLAALTRRPALARKAITLPGIGAVRRPASPAWSPAWASGSGR
jgi:hypothetical protein